MHCISHKIQISSRDKFLDATVKGRVGVVEDKEGEGRHLGKGGGGEGGHFAQLHPTLIDCHPPPLTDL